MPLFYTHTISTTSLLAIWHITEAESFFLEKVPINREITHPHKRLQHLAGRYLLQYLFSDFPLKLIQIANTKKPFLENESHHFSISHCGDYAAAIVSTTHRVGIDIEKISGRVQLIQHKFLNQNELQLLFPEPVGYPSTKHGINQLTLAWSAKEAMFKWYGKGHIDFKQHLHLEKIIGNKEGVIVASIRKETNASLRLHFIFFEEMVLCWVLTAVE